MKKLESKLEKISNLMTKRNNVKVIIKGNSAYTDNETIVLPYIHDNFDINFEHQLYGFLSHEIAHIQWTSKTILNNYKKYFESNPFVFKLWNALEDIRIEKIMIENSPGTEIYIEPLRSYYNKYHYDIFFNMSFSEKIIFFAQLYIQKIDVISLQKAFPNSLIVDDLKEVLSSFERCSDTKTVIELAIQIHQKISKYFLKSDSLPNNIKDNNHLDEEKKEQQKNNESKKLKDGKEKANENNSSNASPEDQINTNNSISKTEETISVDNNSNSKDFPDFSSFLPIKKDEPESKGLSANNEQLLDEFFNQQRPSDDAILNLPQQNEFKEDLNNDENNQFPNTNIGNDESQMENNNSQMNQDNNQESVDEGVNNSVDMEHFDESFLSETVESLNKNINLSFDLGDFFDKKILDKKKKIDLPPKKITIEQTPITFDLNKRSIPITKEFDIENDFSGKGDSTEYLELKKEVHNITIKIRSKLEKLLKVNNYSNWKMDRERGKLNNKSLFNMSLNKDFNKVFKEEKKQPTDSIAVQLLIDQSGSMAGEKIKLAQESAIALSECLKLLNISFEVTGFSSKNSNKISKYSSSIGQKGVYNRLYDVLVHNIFKSFDSNTISGITKLTAGNHNTDGESVRWAANRLLLRPEKRKIMFVFTDGQPSDSSLNNNILKNDLKLAAYEIEKSGIELIAFGIQNHAVKDYYRNYLLIDKIEELPESCMKELTKLLIKKINN